MKRSDQYTWVNILFRVVSSSPLKIACVAVIVAAVSAYPGAESYANQNIYGSNHDGGYEDHHEHYVSC